MGNLKESIIKGLLTGFISFIMGIIIFFYFSFPIELVIGSSIGSSLGIFIINLDYSWVYRFFNNWNKISLMGDRLL